MDHFVGRDALISSLLDRLRSADDGVVEDIMGIHGAGKSLLLEHLVEHAERLPGVEVFFIDMATHGIGDGFRDDYGPTASAAVLWATLRTSTQLMRHVADAAGREFAMFRRICDQELRKTDEHLAYNHITLGAKSTIENPSFHTEVVVSEEAVKSKIRRSQLTIDRAFMQAWTEWTVRRRVLLAIDSFERAADDEMGDWLIAMALQLPRTLAVLSRTPSKREFVTGSDRMSTRYLPDLTADQVHGYFALRFPDGRLDPDIPDVAHHFTDGHAGGVKLVADLVAEYRDAGIDAAALRRMVEHLPDEPGERWGNLVALIVTAAHEPQLREAVDAAALVSSFDEPLLAEMLAPDEKETADVGTVIAALRGLRLIQPVLDLNGKPTDRFCMHEFIRQSVNRKLRAEHPRRWQRLHRRAEQHMFRQVKSSEPGDPRAYSGWRRYEDPQWQAYKREWLFHSAQLTERREIVRARFALVFLEAFWWWGCYHPFSFNRTLLEDWYRTVAATAPAGTGRAPVASRRNPDDEFAAALTFFLDQYPVGHTKTEAPWDDIRKRLLLVQSLCGLRGRSAGQAPSGQAPEEVEQLANAQGMLKVFLAHTRRFRDPSDATADRYYNEALETFERLGDEWVVSWLQFEQADLELERTHPAEAVELVAKSAGRASHYAAESAEVDHELIANLHRVRADAYWLVGDVERALSCYGRAVAHAYWFQGDPVPDEYTQQFYAEMTTRAAERLLFHSDDVHSDGADAGVYLRRARDLRACVPGVEPLGDGELRVLIATNDVAAVAHGLFIRGPLTDEIRDEDSAFMGDWRIRDEDAPDPADSMALLAPPD